MELWYGTPVYTVPIHPPITTLSSVSSASSVAKFVPISYDKVPPVPHCNLTLSSALTHWNIQPRLSSKALLQTLIVPKSLQEEQL